MILMAAAAGLAVGSVATLVESWRDRDEAVVGWGMFKAAGLGLLAWVLWDLGAGA